MKSIVEYTCLYEVETLKSLIDTSPNIKKLIDYGKKHFTKGLSEQEKKEIPDLLKDPKVQAMLKSATKVGQREGWISGGIKGAILGGLIGGFPGLADIDHFFAIVLLGALIGGVSLGFLTSVIRGVLKRWETESNIASGHGVRVVT